MKYQTNRRSKKAAQLRTIYVTLALSLAIMAAFIALSGAWRSSDRTPSESKSTAAAASTYRTPPTDTVAGSVTEPVSDTKKASSETAEPSSIEAPLPEFISPVSGHMFNAFSGNTPVFSLTMNDYRPHTGVDISASVGDDVFASASGVVTEIGEDPMSGGFITVTHSGGAVSTYRNLAPNLPDCIAVGYEVSSGEVIASVGESSLCEIAEEPHLHFELTINGETKDPAEYISFGTADTDYEG